MNTEAINDLAQKFLNGTATAEEKAMLHEWYALNLKGDEEVVAIENEEDREQIKRRLYASVMGRLQVDEVVETRARPIAWLRYAAGIAAAVAVIVFGVWFFSAPRHPDAGQNPGSAQYANDIRPGKNSATLTLADGRTIALSEDKSGVVIGDSSLKYDDHTLVISTERSEERSLNHTGGKDLSVLRDDDRVKANVDPWGGGKAQMLTASTPRGGTYQVILPDETKVWLNADSKLSFPSRFEDRERVVSLQGEAYFEVKRDEMRPFTVKSPGQNVKVLGTHFNIYAYRNEVNIKTTLLEGSVDVNGTILRPNQQAILNASQEIKVREVNPNDVIDWKNGDFVFRGESLENVMRKISRWYDVEVSYASDDLKAITVGGFVSRSRSISAVLQLMERTGKLKFNVEGRRVIVSK